MAAQHLHQKKVKVFFKKRLPLHHSALGAFCFSVESFKEEHTSLILPALKWNSVCRDKQQTAQTEAELCKFRHNTNVYNIGYIYIQYRSSWVTKWLVKKAENKGRLTLCSAGILFS